MPKFNHILLVSLFTVSTATIASELIYTPINPSFGGNPLNSTILINHANAINDYQPPQQDNYFDDYQPETALDRLAASLESRLINQLFSDIGNGTGGTLETSDFQLEVIEDPNGAVTVNITDKATGESTEIQVSGIQQGDL
jgi:curli production assembly/transport component CsgF